MNRLDKDFKSKVNHEVREMSYAGCKCGTRIAIAAIVIVVLCGLGGAGYTLTIGKAQKNAEREVFKSSAAYTEQAASYLAKSYKEYNQADNNTTEKSAIMEYVIIKYPNLDTDSIDNHKLKAFYEKCLEN